jgi:hypothetical protein
MGIISKIFGCFKNQTIELLEASIAQLRLGIFSRLSKRYFKDYGKQNGEYLSAAILNKILLEEPGNDEGKLFSENNALLIEKELQTISEDKIIADAFSYLFAAQTLYLVYLTKEPFSKRAQELGEQATKLSIYIPNTYDICGSDNVQECVLEIMKYASKFINEQK